MERTFVILTCFCAFVYTQTQYQPFGQTNRFQNQYQEQAPVRPTGQCRELNERYPVSGSCDRYIECINGTAEEKLCPDGLRYNPNVNFDVYPCQYPNEVPCLERSSLQPPQPTELCPHQFGYFKLGDARNCSGFRNCVNGVGYDFVCPDGLAFNSETYRCEWPDEVADCDAEAFLGFRCPEVPISRELGPQPDIDTTAPSGTDPYQSVAIFSAGADEENYVPLADADRLFQMSDNNCQKYFLCIDGHPRVLYCGGESAFDDLTSTCVSADEVGACPAELRAAAVRAKDDAKQLLAKEVEFNAYQLTRKPSLSYRN